MFKRNRNQTPGAQATRAQTNIFVRIIGCGFLVYTIREMLISDDFSTQEVWKVVLVIVLGLAAAAIILLTVLELIRNFKNGVYSPKYYDTGETEEETSETEAVEAIEAGEITEGVEIEAIDMVEVTVDAEIDAETEEYDAAEAAEPAEEAEIDEEINNTPAEE